MTTTTTPAVSTTTRDHRDLNWFFTLAELLADIQQIDASMATLDEAALHAPAPATKEELEARFATFYVATRPFLELGINQVPVTSHWHAVLSGLLTYGDLLTGIVTPDFKAGKDV